MAGDLDLRNAGDFSTVGKSKSIERQGTEGHWRSGISGRGAWKILEGSWLHQVVAE